MILVFIVLGFIIVITGFIFVLLLSCVQLNVETLHIKKEQKTIHVKLKIIFSLLFLNRLPYFQITITHQKIRKWMQEKKIDIQALRKKNTKPLKYILYFKDLDFQIKDFKLTGYFETFEPILTSYLYTFLQALIPILFARNIVGKYSNQLQMIHANENKVNIELRCIISLRLVNIINTIYEIKKKGGTKKNGKSSDRKSYAYSYE